MKGDFEMPDHISENAQDLLEQMINYKNDERITFAEVIYHPWFTQPEEVPIDKGVIENLQKYKSDSLLK